MPTLLMRAASVAVTNKLLLFFVAGVLWFYNEMPGAVLGLYIPLIFLALNLFAALLAGSRRLTTMPLFVMHVSLLAFLGLLAIGQLTKLEGRVELSEGEAFSGELIDYTSGLWHSWSLDQVRFVNQGVSVNYRPGVSRSYTDNRVTWFDNLGQAHDTLIGDQHPLVLNGYRFYTTFNKGFAPTFIWYPESQSRPVMGTVHLPGYPIHEYEQARSWQLPETQHNVWVQLVMQQEVVDTAHSFELSPPEQHYLVLRLDDKRYEVRPGESVVFAGGRLEYSDLRMWMGYKVYYDWTRPWLLACILIILLSMAWHYIQKFTSSPWLLETQEKGGD